MVRGCASEGGTEQPRSTAASTDWNSVVAGPLHTGLCENSKQPACVSPKQGREYKWNQQIGLWDDFVVETWARWKESCSHGSGLFLYQTLMWLVDDLLQVRTKDTASPVGSRGSSRPGSAQTSPRTPYGPGFQVRLSASPTVIDSPWQHSSCLRTMHAHPSPRVGLAVSPTVSQTLRHASY